MKKILLLITIAIMTCITFGINNQIFAKDVIPNSPITNTQTIGMYQVGDDITIYKEPDENSHILYRVRWNRNNEFFPEEIGFDKFFAVFIEKKALALVNVVDYTDDWVQIVYNNATEATGWIKKDDPYKFMTWNNFYNTYGKKYGLMLLHGSPESCKNIKSETNDLGQNISTMNYPQKINLNVIRGNWALVSVMDLDRTPKTGYIRWRSDDGIRYFFPDLR